ncbi:MAG: HlyC/CorC family transporter [Chlorobi bacterium]|nr:HlyC/CorC family transporter [Chlorobiota bacterium]
MTGSLILDVSLFFLTFLFSGIISTGEFAILSIPRSLLEKLVDEEGNRPAELALHLRENEDSFTATVQIATRFLNAGGAVVGVLMFLRYATAELNRLLPDFTDAFWWGGLFLLIVLISGIIVLANVLLPRAFGTRYARALALRLAPMMKMLFVLTRGPQKILLLLADMILFPFKDKSTFAEPELSEEEIRDMLEESSKSGIIDATEHKLIESVLNFTDKVAHEVMIPRTEIVAIDLSMPPDDVLKVVTESRYTRLPVYEGAIDNIKGIIYSKDVINLILHKNLIILHDILRPAYFVPESKPIAELLREFQRKKVHLAIVVDEFGGTEGIITMEDILEEIVGDILDEYDEEPTLLQSIGEGKFIVQGAMNVTEFNEATGMEIPEDDAYETMGGFISYISGKIPQRNETYRVGDYAITILEADERKVEKMKIEPAPEVVPGNTAETRRENESIT